MGAYSKDNILYILNYLKKIAMLDKPAIIGSYIQNLQLTPKGWERFEELKKGTIESKKVWECSLKITKIIGLIISLNPLKRLHNPNRF